MDADKLAQWEEHCGSAKVAKLMVEVERLEATIKSLVTPCEAAELAAAAVAKYQEEIERLSKKVGHGPRDRYIVELEGEVERLEKEATWLRGAMRHAVSLLGRGEANSALWMLRDKLGTLKQGGQGTRNGDCRQCLGVGFVQGVGPDGEPDGDNCPECNQGTGG